MASRATFFCQSPVSLTRAGAAVITRIRGPRAEPAQRHQRGGRRRSWPVSPPPAPRGGGPVHGARKLHQGGLPAARIPAATAANGEILSYIHTNDSSKTLLKNEAVYKYMLDTMVYPREHECLRELRLITERHTYGFMQSPPDEAQFLSMLLKVMGARNTIEVGVFTGSSVLATALALPDDGRVVAIDVSREYFDLGLPVIARAGVAHKVDFREGPALGHLDALLADEANAGAFDFSFVDADKPNYGAYHEQLLRLVRVGGVLAYDNTLWGGTVALPDGETPPLTEFDRASRASMMAFNAKIAADERVEAVQLPVADGITLCRRVA